MSVVDELYSEIERGIAGDNIGLKTGLPKLDWYTGGFQKNSFRLIFGKSGSGKSSLSVYTIYRTLKDYPDKPFIHLYFSMEMRGTVLLAKLLNLYLLEEYDLEVSFMDLFSIRETLPKDIYSKVLEARKWLDSVIDKVVIYDKKMNADAFYAEMMTFLEEHGHFTKSDDGKRTQYIPDDPNLIINVVLDHGGLLQPIKGRTKKEEIDLCSAYCVRFKEVCGISIDFLMQENRTAGSTDRLKMDMSEPTLDEVKESGNVGNDCTICVAVYNPIDYKIKTYRGYNVLNDGGMGSAIRGLLLLKTRFGSSHKAIVAGFQGSVGRFVELPKPDDIDYTLYQSWKDESFDTKKEKEEEKDEVLGQEPKKEITYSF